ncbi:MAG: serine hydrolase [Bacteroidales bacterium]
MNKFFSHFRLFFLISVNSTLIISGQTPKYTTEVEERIKQVENNLAGWVQTQDNSKWTLVERMALYNIKGISIAVVHNYEIEWARGYGWADVSENRLVTEKTLFQAASISKSLNGVGVLKLVQEKKLDLNSDINKYLKTWKFPYDTVSHNKKITIASLLSHTAGLTIHGFPGYSRGETLPSLSQILDGQKPANTQAVRSLSEPGIKVVYSGGGVTISQMIVMDITRQPYDGYMQQNVLKPLGMGSSFFTQPPAEAKKALLATGYKSNGEEVRGKYHIYPEQAAAGLWTNPTDLCRYIIETQLLYKGKSGKVLTPEMTRLRLTPVIANSALGVFIDSKGTAKYFMHNGGNEGFSCYSTGSLDDGVGVVIMCNSDNGAILEEIVNSVATVYNWKDYYKPVIKNTIKIPDAILNSYVGKYNIGGPTATISKIDNDLVINAYNLKCKLYFTSDVDFFVKEYRAELKFLTDSEGKVTGFSSNGMIAKKIE